MLTLGIDTSNYTTSVCLYDSVKDEIYQKKLLFPVKEGENCIFAAVSMGCSEKNYKK